MTPQTPPPLETQLDDLLAEGVAEASLRESTAFDEAAGPYSGSIVLFGARKLGLRTLDGLRRSGVEPLAFSDNDESLWGRSLDGIPVLSPAEAAQRFGRQAVFAMTIWGRGSAGREAHLRQLGCERVAPFLPLYWKYAEALLPQIPATDLPHKVLEQAGRIRQCLEVWGDEQSRLQYLAQLRWRLHGDFETLPDPVPEPIYFPRSLFGPVEDEVFIDCGAYTGDTFQPFLDFCGSHFQRIVAVEPDLLNLRQLEQTIQTLPPEIARRIEIIRTAVADKIGTVPFSASGTLGSGDLMVLAHQAPVLAITAYHRQEPLWQIPLLIHELNPEYRLFLRQHIQLVEDLVCYAVPPDRMGEQR